MIRKTLSILDVTPKSYKNFSCGQVKLDEYLKKYARGNHKKNLGKTFVLQEEGLVIGFYTISMASIEFSTVPENMRVSLPKYPIPVARIGRLAVHENSKGNGIGKFLLIDALQKIYVASQLIAAYAIVVDAKDQQAKAFYKHFGFIECQDSELSLLLHMETLNQFFLK